MQVYLCTVACFVYNSARPVFSAAPDCGIHYRQKFECQEHRNSRPSAGNGCPVWLEPVLGARCPRPISISMGKLTK